MSNFDQDMLNYAKLAELSHRKRQPLGSDKLLVLTGVSACQAGCLDVSARCHELIVRHHPRHQLAKFDSIPDALRSDDFPQLVKRLQKLCPSEQAEFLVHEWGLDETLSPEVAGAELEAQTLEILRSL